jgi:tetratricopeptide (TPR) repeat protein
VNRPYLVAAVTLALSVLSASPGRAQDSTRPSAADLEAAKAHYQRGAALVEAGDHAAAIDEFKQSYRLSRNALLLYNIAVTLDQKHEPSLARFYYEKFLALASGDSDNHRLARSRLHELATQSPAEPGADSAATAASAPKAPTPNGPHAGAVTATDGADRAGIPASGRAPAQAPVPGAATGEPVHRSAASSPTELVHQPVLEAPPGLPLDISAGGAADWQITLFYRGTDQRDFAATPMLPRYDEFVGRVPAARMTGKTVQYYLEARNRAGEVVARIGRSNSPSIVVISKDAPPRYYADVRDGLNPDPADGKPGAGGYLDAGSRRFARLKWATTGTAAASLSFALASYLVAARRSAQLEGQAVLSTQLDCGNGDPNPCQSFAEQQRQAQDSGQRFQSMYRASVGLGVLTGLGAGYLWYREWQTEMNRSESAPPPPPVAVVPIIGRDVIGSAVSFTF